jgi:hypothetical protein
MIDALEVEVLVQEYVTALETMLESHYAERFSLLTPPTVSVEYGKKFARIVFSDSQRMVHSFVDTTTGNVLKAAGWTAPQKDKGGLAVRYSLTDTESKARCFAEMDPYGGYLYKK